MQKQNKTINIKPKILAPQGAGVKRTIAASIAGLILAGSASAEETYYVDDELTITMRSGASTQHQIIRTLKSGTKLDVIEIDKDSGYSLARTAGGTEGWVITRYLSAQPIAKHRLAAAESKVTKLEKEIAEVRSQLTQTSDSRQALDKKSTNLSNENSKLSKELNRIKEISRNAITLDKDNKLLREKLIKLETDLQAMEQQNSVLKDRSARDWFITGAGVTVLGILIGLIVPRLRIRRKSNWNEL